MVTEAQRAACPREHTVASAAKALGAFQIDDNHPFFDDPSTVVDLLTQAHGLTQVLGTAFTDAQDAYTRGQQSELQALNANFIASALDGIGSLIALAMFLRGDAR